MVKKKRKNKFLKFLRLYFLIGIAFYLIIIPLTQFAFSTCRIDGFLEENQGCTGFETLQEQYKSSLLGIKTASSPSPILDGLSMFTVNYIFYPIGFIGTVLSSIFG